VPYLRFFYNSMSIFTLVKMRASVCFTAWGSAVSFAFSTRHTLCRNLFFYRLDRSQQHLSGGLAICGRFSVLDRTVDTIVLVCGVTTALGGGIGIPASLFISACMFGLLIDRIAHPSCSAFSSLLRRQATTGSLVFASKMMFRNWTGTVKAVWFHFAALLQAQGRSVNLTCGVGDSICFNASGSNCSTVVEFARISIYMQGILARSVHERAPCLMRR
jgi:hypothetical protein